MKETISHRVAQGRGPYDAAGLGCHHAACTSAPARPDEPWNPPYANVLYPVDATKGTVLRNSGATVNGALFAAPIVDGGRVFVGAWDQNLCAFGL